MAGPVRLLYCYAAEDEAMREALDRHLSSLKLEGLLESWHQALIPAGNERQAEIAAQVESADILLLLVSSDFMASASCQALLAQVQRARAERRLHVVPVLVRPVDWNGGGLEGLRMVPRDGVAVTLWRNQDTAWLDVTAWIRCLVTGSITPSIPSSAQRIARSEHELAGRGADSEVPLVRVQSDVVGSAIVGGQHNSVNVTVNAVSSDGALLNLFPQRRLVRIAKNSLFVVLVWEKLKELYASAVKLIGMKLSTVPVTLKSVAVAAAVATAGATVVSIRYHSGSPRGSEAKSMPPRNVPMINPPDTIAVPPLVLHLKSHRCEASGPAIDGSDTRVVTSGPDGKWHLWDLSNRAKILVELGTYQTTSASFSPDGKFIITTSKDGTARVWEADRGRLLHQFVTHAGEITSASFSPDGRLFATSSKDGTARLWGADTGSLYRTFVGHPGEITSASFSPDGRLFATSSKDGTARLWGVNTDSLDRTLVGHPGEITSASFSPDGRLFATASRDGTAQVWEVDMGRPLRELMHHSDVVTSASFSPDGSLFVAISTDGTAQVWDIGTRDLPRVLANHAVRLISASFSPNGRYVIANGKNDCVIWRLGRAP